MTWTIPDVKMVYFRNVNPARHEKVLKIAKELEK